MVEEAPARVAELAAWGVEFDRDGDRVDLHQEAAHSRARVLHAGGDATGAAIERALLQRLGDERGHRGHRPRGHPPGAGRRRLRRGSSSATSARARGCGWARGAVILASGGAAALWRHTTNPAGSTGDGVALAYEAGADVADLEFLQFHPTVLALPGAPAFLISEAVRGEGALVVDAAGRRFLLDTDPRGELAPRDVVARAIWEEMTRSGSASVFLDCRGAGERLVERFPTVVATCREHGVDPVERPIPIAPAAHYTIGGVVTDLDGATTVPGLYACGEVARTGVHGANRLASNSLLEGLVFGRRAAVAALAGLAERPAGDGHRAARRRRRHPARRRRRGAGASRADVVGLRHQPHRSRPRRRPGGDRPDGGGGRSGHGPARAAAQPAGPDRGPADRRGRAVPRGEPGRSPPW